MLKCGQKDNKNYTFGVSKDQILEADKKEAVKSCCASCGTYVAPQANFCPSCGEKI